LCCQVVEIGQSLRTLFCAQVWENGYAGHGFGRRYRFLPVVTEKLKSDIDFAKANIKPPDDMVEFFELLRNGK
jgi:hypothetical protein